MLRYYQISFNMAFNLNFSYFLCQSFIVFNLPDIIGFPVILGPWEMRSFPDQIYQVFKEVWQGRSEKKTLLNLFLRSILVRLMRKKDFSLEYSISRRPCKNHFSSGG